MEIMQRHEASVANIPRNCESPNGKLSVCRTETWTVAKGWSHTSTTKDSRETLHWVSKIGKRGLWVAGSSLRNTSRYATLAKRPIGTCMHSHAPLQRLALVGSGTCTREIRSHSNSSDEPVTIEPSALSPGNGQRLRLQFQGTAMH
ncbi:hypothetical protein TRVL_04787 [Trypanosoma vivax]|nr:hypothetical protein TRVL_04787 [Trypanosoma vivax]